ncbi:MAG: ATP-grasp domain-containing protein [Thermoleophilaceae bacterium]
MHTVWIGAAGTGTAYGLAASLREHWGDGVRIVAADINPPHLVATAALADETVQVPLLVEEEFVDDLFDGFVRFGVDTYVPILDDEILLAARLRDAGSLPGVTVVAPSAEVAELCLDKLAMADWLARSGLPGPRTWPIVAAPGDALPLLVKPRRGVGSAGVVRVEDAESLERLGGDLVAQELLGPPEITIDAFRTRCVCRERLEVKAGVSTKARVFVDEELAGLSRALAERLPLTGAFCFQVMRAPAGGSWQITDVNPRHGAGSRLSAAMGFDVMAAGMAAVWGEDPDRFLRLPLHERFVVRAYTEHVLV